MSESRKPYPSDVTNEEWSLVVPYLTLMTEDARSESILCVNCSTAFDTWFDTESRGVACRTICDHGQRFISNRNGNYPVDIPRGQI